MQTSLSTGRHTRKRPLRRAVAGIAAFAVVVTASVSASFSLSVASAQAQSSSASSTSSSCSPVSTTSTSGHWTFDEGTGITVGDTSGLNLAGTAYGSAAWSVSGTPVISGNAGSMTFDGSDDYVAVINPSSFNFGTTSFTAAGFVKTTVGNRSVWGNFSSMNKGWGLYLYSNGGVNFFGYGSAGNSDASQVSSTNVLDGQWHHLAGVYTRSGQNLTIDTYVDGVLIGSHTTAVGDISANSALLFGRYLGQPMLQGSLDDIRVYGRALTSAEVSALSQGCGDPVSSSSSVSSGNSSSNNSSNSSSNSSSSSSNSSSVSSGTSSMSSSSTSSSTGSVGTPPMCNGLSATIYVWNDMIVGGPMNGQEFNGVLRGTAGNDVIVGTNKADIIGGKAGDDTICGNGGKDVIYGDDGKDWISAGNGRNIVLGNKGDDTITVGNGNNIIDGGQGRNKCTVGRGHNMVFNCQIMNKNHKKNPFFPWLNGYGDDEDEDD